MDDRTRRAIRGSVFAAIATVTAAAAHTLGGGVPPSPLFCLVLFALAAPLALAVTSARPGPWRAALAVGAGQLLFHLAFALVGDIGGSTPSAMIPRHLHGASPTVGMTDAVVSTHADMTLAHVVAAVVTVALVCRGEAALAAIGAWIVRRAAVPAVGPTLPGIPRRVAALPAPPRALLILPPGLGRRGPPIALSSPHAA